MTVDEDKWFQAKICFYRNDQAYGFVKLDEHEDIGDIFFHSDRLSYTVDRDLLQKDRPVIVKVSEKKKGKWVVTDFQLQPDKKEAPPRGGASKLGFSLPRVLVELKVTCIDAD